MYYKLDRIRKELENNLTIKAYRYVLELLNEEKKNLCTCTNVEKHFRGNCAGCGKDIGMIVRKR